MTMTKDRLQVTEFIRGKREKVFEAWTRAETMRQWFCPEELSVRSVEADPQVGKGFRISMAGNEVYTAIGTYREIRPNQKLVFTWRWDEPDAAETLITVEFSDKEGGTEVTLTQERFTDPEQVKGHHDGWTSALKHLAKHFSNAAS
jgi:uncharacterized protein YndB with AHSA1/START domain